MTRTYSDLQSLATVEERYDYLSLRASVGVATFGFERYLNQRFYTSREWKQVRQFVIARDNGCNLGVPNQEIRNRVYIHHMNPMTVDDLTQGNEDVLNPEFLISVDLRTHNAIHYGDRNTLPRGMVERKPRDTIPW